MSCARVQERLGAYLEADLAEREGAQIETHLEGCPSCHAELEALRATRSLLRGLPHPAPPPHLAQRVIARLRDGEGRPRWYDRFGARSVGVPLAAAALAAVVFVGVRALEPGTEAEPPLALVDPAGLPPLDLGPLVGAAEAPSDAVLDGVLEQLRSEPRAFAQQWSALSAPSREVLGPALAARARARGDARSLAEALVASGDPRAAELAALFEGPATR